MPVTTLKLAGKRFVVLPEDEYREMQRKLKSRRNGSVAPRTRRPARMTKQDRGDVAEAIRRAKEPSRPYAELRKELGLA